MGKGDDLDWNDLRFFRHAAEEKTLAGAARALGVEHTTVGRRLGALERALGASLVLRGPDGLRLTALGEKLLPLAVNVEQAVEAIRAAVHDQRSRVRLALPSGMTKLFTGNLERLARMHPGLTLELVSGARPVDLKRGEADLSIRSGPVTDKDLIARELCESGWSLFASDSYLARHKAPTDIEDLSGHEVIGYEASLAMVPAAIWLEAHARGANVVLRSREMTDMAAAAASGLGIAAIPCILGDEEPALRRLTPKVIASRTVSLVYRREQKVSKEVRAVIKFVTEVITANATRISGLRK